MRQAFIGNPRGLQIASCAIEKLQAPWIVSGILGCLSFRLL